MTECELCQRAGGRYELGRTCCKVRFLLSMPTREIRLGWLGMWRKADAAQAAEVERMVRERWEQR